MLVADWINDVFACIAGALLLWAWFALKREGRPAAWGPWPEPAKESFVDAYRLTPHVHYNRGEIEHSEMCACLCCEQIFPPQEISAWHRSQRGDTAVCPRCGVASVVGSGAGVKLTPRLVHRAHVVRDGAETRHQRVG